MSSSFTETETEAGRICENEDALLRLYETEMPVWMSLVSANGWPYLLTCTDNGDVFLQGFRTGDENGQGVNTLGVESGVTWVHEMGEQFWPVKVVAVG